MISVHDSERCIMRYRIAIWAAAGFLVASGWAVYFLVASGRPYDRTDCVHSCPVNLPVVILGSQFPVSLSSALVANVATYALAGLVVEALRRQFNRSN